MYVKHFPSDNSGVNEEIADKLRSKGVTVTTGSEAPPSNIDAVVTYIDKWMWDITLYMIELTITIRDPQTQSPLATGNSRHGSLTRKSQTDMVDEVVNSIYNSSNNAAAPRASETPTPQPTQSNTTFQQVPAQASINNPSETPTSKILSQKLRELKVLRDDGTITEDEYNNTRKRLIENL